jgi:hypothetical protein
MCPFFIFCLLFIQPPAPVIPDGQGGFVPFTNAGILPDGSLRDYDPAIDGIMGPDGSIYFPPMPYYPQGRVTVGPPEPMPEPTPPRPPQRRAPRHATRPPKSEGGGCYGPDGVPVTPVPPDCQTQPALPPWGRG